MGAVWCGHDKIAAIVSPGPEEGHWYNARLHLIEVETGRDKVVYESRDQLGWPAAAPSGAHLVVVEAAPAQFMPKWTQ